MTHAIHVESNITVTTNIQGLIHIHMNEIAALALNRSQSSKKIPSFIYDHKVVSLAIISKTYCIQLFFANELYFY